MTLPVRVRLTLWYSILLGGALLVFAVTVYVVMADTLTGNLDASLLQRTSQLATTADVANGHLNFPSSGEQGDSQFIPAALLRPSGQLGSGAVPLVMRHWLSAQRSPPPASFHAVSLGTLRLATAPIRDNSTVVGYVLVWQSTGSVEEARRSLLIVMVTSGLVLLLVAGLGGLFLARRALTPVRRITGIAAGISASDLRQRVPVGSARDELSELALTFNAMIDRLDASVERERQFTGDASHELRSPLAVIRAETTLALEHRRAPEEYRRVLTVIAEESEVMEEIISALLLLARLESLDSLQSETVPLRRLVEAASEQCRATLGSTTVALECSVPIDLEVLGSASLLTRALRNLLDNAIKVSPPGGTIQVRARAVDDRIELMVLDQGPGIAPENQAYLFDPFFQVSAARTPDESHGLGLAICRRIVRAHGGDVTVVSKPGHGAAFTIALPRADRT